MTTETTTWAAAVARYAAAVARVSEVLTEDGLRDVADALHALREAHFAVLHRSLERARKCSASSVSTAPHGAESPRANGRSTTADDAELS